MNKVIVYIHGKGGNAAEAEHYVPLFPECSVIGFDYQSQTPWEAREEFSAYFARLRSEYDAVCVIANSIGAYFLMQMPDTSMLQQVWMISPIVDMEALIVNMMRWAGVTEEELRRRQTIPTDFGETLSWEYLCYVRRHPIKWTVSTKILYGERDSMTAPAVMAAFAEKTGAALETLPGAHHWIHSESETAFLDLWIQGLLIATQKP